MRKKLIIIVPASLFLFLVLIVYNKIRISAYISSAEINHTIHAAADSLEKNYIFQDLGKVMSDSLRHGLTIGLFDKRNPREFGKKVNEYLRKISGDKHFSFFFEPNVARDLKIPERKNFNDHFLETEKENNFYIFPIKFLEDNIGYFRIDELVDPTHAGDKIEMALDSLSHAKAIIIDLRNNNGGEPEMVQRIISHFYSKDTSIHLNDIYFRNTNKTIEYWTLPNLKGNYMPQMPLYILTGKHTASGAEELAYDLINLHRATIIGEPTAGGAHPGDLLPVGDRFVMFMPEGNALNPYSKSNWEKTGVVPDIYVKEDKALDKAIEIIKSKASN